VLLAPEPGSPKFQVQRSGGPVEVSVKLTIWPTVGEAETLKSATGITGVAFEIPTDFVMELVAPPVKVTVRLTLKVRAEGNGWMTSSGGSVGGSMVVSGPWSQSQTSFVTVGVICPV
jgi:hypothetical protein